MFGRIKSFVPKNFAFQTVLAALLVQAVWMRKLITDIIDKNEHYGT